MQYTEWLSKVAVLASSPITKRNLTKISAREDLSLSPLQELWGQGYVQVTWDASKSKHGKCRDLHNRKWPLKDFISNLSHSAPIAERSHPNDTGCSVIVEGPNLPKVRIDYAGNSYDLA